MAAVQGNNYTDSEESKRRHQETLETNRQLHEDFLSRTKKMHRQFFCLSLFQTFVIMTEVFVIAAAAYWTVKVAIENVGRITAQTHAHEILENTINHLKLLNIDLVLYYQRTRLAMEEAQIEVFSGFTVDPDSEDAQEEQRTDVTRLINLWVNNPNDRFREESIIVIGTHLDNMARCWEAGLCDQEILLDWAAEYYYDFWSYFWFYVECERMVNSQNQSMRDYWRNTEEFVKGPVIDWLVERGRFDNTEKPTFEGPVERNSCEAQPDPSEWN